MDYEKKYKEALERAREWYNKTEPDSYTCIVESIFPELKESEDENIRKELINYFTEGREFLSLCSFGRDEILAWLEKQGKQKSIDTCDSSIIDGKEFPASEKRDFGYFSKPADKVEPKFKVGDWVVNKNGTVQQILSYKNGIYKHTNGYSSKMFEDEWRLWDITKDAKDGDVLATDDGNICIFDGAFKDGKYPFAYCGLTRHRFEFYDRRLPFTHNNIYPATKEQRGTLIKAMTDAGYTFDFNKKELKKIENHADWSEGDEAYKLFAISAVKDYYDKENPLRKDIVDWLQSLKQRVSWKPSNEQIIALRWVLNNIPYNKHKEEISGLLDQIKDL